jgi:type IV secretory pathway TraG/TraD family ATPase VirD4
MGSQIYYRLSNQEIADYLERCLGRRSDFAHSHTVRQGVQTSEGRSEQEIPLLTAQAIKQLGDEDIIGFHRRLPPFKARRMDWRRFPVLVQRHAIFPLNFLLYLSLRTGEGVLSGKEPGKCHILILTS